MPERFIVIEWEVLISNEDDIIIANSIYLRSIPDALLENRCSNMWNVNLRTNVCIASSIGIHLAQKSPFHNHRIFKLYSLFFFIRKQVYKLNQFMIWFLPNHSENYEYSNEKNSWLTIFFFVSFRKQFLCRHGASSDFY